MKIEFKIEYFQVKIEVSLFVRENREVDMGKKKIILRLL